MIYLDSCALVKLVRTEDGSDELQQWLDERADELVATSELVRTELIRVIRRNNHNDQGQLIDPDSLEVELAEAQAVLDAVHQVTLTSAMLDRAAAFEHPMLRTLDAIHLAAASEFDTATWQFVTYDRRLADVVRGIGAEVVAPH